MLVTGAAARNSITLVGSMVIGTLLLFVQPCADLTIAKETNTTTNLDTDFGEDQNLNQKGGLATETN
ncbi:hypothetical protein [Ferrimonas sp.]|uniref:hypothetical protein n=1 Tax=Ferrimonas sp. TaxID=2080861 RepID=UPI003A8FFCC2